MSMITLSAVQIGDVTPVTLDNARLYPLTILGASVPQFPLVTNLEAGMLIENVPNTNFSNNFASLTTTDGPVVIVGNAQLTSLEGKAIKFPSKTMISASLLCL